MRPRQLCGPSAEHQQQFQLIVVVQIALLQTESISVECTDERLQVGTGATAATVAAADAAAAACVAAGSITAVVISFLPEACQLDRRLAIDRIECIEQIVDVAAFEK